MRGFRSLLAVVTGVGLATFGMVVPAGAAATAPACQLLADPSGDTTIEHLYNIGDVVGGALGAPSVDIVNGDLASDRDFVYAEVRVASLTNPVDVYRDEAQWAVYWKLVGSPVQYGVTVSAATGVGQLIGGDPATPVDVRVDKATSTISWTVPRALLPALASPGQVFTELRATARSRVLEMDAAVATQNYADGAASCLLTSDRPVPCLLGSDPVGDASSVPGLSTAPADLRSVGLAANSAWVVGQLGVAGLDAAALSSVWYTIEWQVGSVWYGFAVRRDEVGRYRGYLDWFDTQTFDGGFSENVEVVADAAAGTLTFSAPRAEAPLLERRAVLTEIRALAYDDTVMFDVVEATTSYVADRGCPA